MEMHNGRYQDAYNKFTKILADGYSHWRISWYAAQAAFQIGNRGEAEQHLNSILLQNPNFTATREYLDFQEKL